MGRILITIGVVFILAGLWLSFGPKSIIPGKLPGDLSFSVGKSKIYFPITTCLLFSALLSLISYLFKLFK